MKQHARLALALRLDALICLGACRTEALENDRNQEAEEVVIAFFAA